MPLEESQQPAPHACATSTTHWHSKAPQPRPHRLAVAMLPIPSPKPAWPLGSAKSAGYSPVGHIGPDVAPKILAAVNNHKDARNYLIAPERSEERRVGKECRSRHCGSQ